MGKGEKRLPPSKTKLDSQRVGNKNTKARGAAKERSKTWEKASLLGKNPV